MNHFIFLYVVAACCLFTNCQSSSTGFLKGEGDEVKQELALEQLHGISLGIYADVILTQGSPQHIAMEGQKNVLDNIKREVREGVWYIEFNKNVRDAMPVTIHITLASLDQVDLSGSGTVRSTNKFPGADQIDINVAGSGNVMLEYTASSTDLNLSGSGKIKLSGESDLLSIAITGSGNVNAIELRTNESEVHISGSGNASINAHQSLEASITGSGNVQYSGNATVNSNITGSGGVNKIN